MANDFKRFVKKDIGTGEGASGSTVYTVPSSSSTAMDSIVSFHGTSVQHVFSAFALETVKSEKILAQH